MIATQYYSHDLRKLKYSGPDPRKAPLGAFSGVPTEVITMIIQSLPTYKDIINMAFTNTMIFDISHYVIQRRYREEIPRWRGDRLACIGDDCHPSDFDKLWTKEELATFKELSATKKSDCDEHRFNLHSILFDSGAFKEVKFRQDGGVYLWQYTDERCREENLRSDLKLRPGDMRSSLSFELLTPAFEFRDDVPWVICNHTKKQVIFAQIHLFAIRNMLML